MTKRSIVTGATSGIGREYARSLASRGHDLVISGRRTEQLETVAAELRGSHGVEVTIVIGDLVDPAVEAELVAAAEGEPVDWLVNSAGAGFGESLDAVDPGRIGDAFALLVEVPARLTRAVLPGMYRNGSGTIVNVGSLAGRIPVPGSALYVAAKAALERLSEALAIEAARHGVVVQTLLPGFVRTDFHRDDPELPAAYDGRGAVRWAQPDRVVAVSTRRVERARWYLERRTARRGERSGESVVPRPRDVIVVPGVSNRMLVAAARVIPRRLLYHLIGTRSRRR